MKPLVLLASFALSSSGNPVTTLASGPWRGQGLTVQPVNEVAAVRPGQPFYVGLFLHHDQHCHTYWQSPGLAGVPTNMAWTLPEGWTAGEIEWPAPDKVKMAQIDTHGFERDVLLMVKITPPAKTEGKTVTLKTKANWMCCGTTCNPGFHDFTFTLPVTAGKEPEWNAKWHKVFEKERANFPVAAAGWKLSAVRKDQKIVLTGEAVEKDAPVPDKAVFFSTDNFICSNLPQTWTKTANGFEAELGVSEFPPKDQSVLRGIITGGNAWTGKDKRAALVEVPVK